MIVISAIASYIPEGFELNAGKMEAFAFDQGFLDNKIGIEKVSRKALEEETSDMCVSAFAALRKKTGISTDKIDFVLVCTQNPDGHGIPHTSAVVHAKLGLSTSCAAFDISLGCSGYASSLSVGKSFMEANGLLNGLLFTCDPYSKILDPQDRSTILLFGDAATVTLLSSAQPGAAAWEPTAFRFFTDGARGDSINNHGGHLHMDGHGVVVFSLREVPREINGLLKERGLSMQDVDLFLFHQGSKYIIDNLRKRLQLSEEQAPMKLSNHGNTVSSSIPLMLEEYLEREGVNRILCVGFGVGLSITTALLEKRPD